MMMDDVTRSTSGGSPRLDAASAGHRHEPATAAELGGRRRYAPPELRRVGSLRDTVLSPSPGNFESGYGAGFMSPT